MSKENIPTEEVDLGSLFKIIGKGFQNLFNAIGQFFKTIFHYVILALLFLRNNALKLGLAMFIGAAIGLYLDLTKPEQYSSSMIVQPNFKSTQQLYKNINFYHELIKQKDSALLSKTLNISVKEAASLKEFSIKPIKNKKEEYQVFNDFIQEVDTATIETINIKELKKSFTDYDYNYHEVKVKSLNNIIFEKLAISIINSVENNAYFKNQKKLNRENLLQNENVLLKSLQEVDTLRNIYNEVLLLEANKAKQGTNITLAEGAKETNEILLFKESLKLNKKLITNNKEKAETIEIVNIVSTFSKVGAKERKLYKKMTFILGLGLSLMMLTFILFRQLNSYLINYKKD